MSGHCVSAHPSPIEWLATASGQVFCPLDPVPAHVHIEDIAHALSHLCRFAGHTRTFYSVAQHAYLVSHYCAPADALWGLLHDASEAYLCDIPSPVKHSPLLAGYRLLEQRVQRVVLERFALPLSEPPSVKAADQRLLQAELRDVMVMPESFVLPACDLPVIHPVPAPVAKSWFLSRFAELTGGSR